MAAPIPQFSNPITSGLSGSLGSFPLHLEATPLALVVLSMLVGIFVAAVSVILVYHWRRFPFEHETFAIAERIYFIGTACLLIIAVVGILIS